MTDNNKTHKWGAPHAIVTDRAGAELRRGLPVVIDNGEMAIIVISSEQVNKHNLEIMRNCWSVLSQQDPTHTHFGSLISDRRADTLKIATKGKKAIVLNHQDDWSEKIIKAIGDPTLDLTYPLKGPFKVSENANSNLCQAAIKLLKVAGLLPSALVLLSGKSEIFEQFKEQEILSISNTSIASYDTDKLYEIEEVARTSVPLSEANVTSIVSFRPRSGGVENLALIINNPDLTKPVLTRIHSECFTGDLLGSLKCDCGSQLQGAIAEIEQAGGGILLYLAQEGRGVGLTAKIKAYTLQEQGFDTVDANLRLGFEIDERQYEPAGKILKMLNVSAIELMTNNPKKINAMEKVGINVVKRVAHLFPTNKHNEQYLNTKRDRTGHMID